VVVAMTTWGRKLAKWVFIFAGWLVGLFCLALFIANRPAKPDLTDRQKWTLIKHYRGALGDSHSDVVVLAYVYKRPYLEVLDDHFEVLQNRVDVKDPEGNLLAQWTWPGGKVEYAAGWCEVLDVNNDGRREILLFEGLKSVRFVAYEGGRLYEPRNSSLDSVHYEIGPLDLNNDAQLEFIEDYPFYPQVPIPRIYHWDQRLGFRDVSKKFPEFYSKQIIPEFERKAGQSEPTIQKIYIKAIDAIRKDFLTAGPPVALTN
jgi:hypothetical protein